MALPRVRKGDMFAVNLKYGSGIIQCVKEATKTELEIMRVIPGIYNDIKLCELSYISSLKETFFALLPIKYALKKNLISFLGNFSVPIDSDAPKYFRTKHVIKGVCLGWHIVERETLQYRFVQSLSSEELLFSPWGTFSIPDIIERIESNWSPTNWQ